MIDENPLDKFTVTRNARINGSIVPVRVCEAYLLIDSCDLGCPMPPEVINRFYIGETETRDEDGVVVEVTRTIPEGVTLADALLCDPRMVDGGCVIRLAISHKLRPGTPTRIPHTTQQDVQDWEPYMNALGYTFEELLTKEEAMSLTETD